MPSYQLAISNIAWQKDDDETVYAAMQQAGFTGLELAPTRIFSEAPYENLTSALLFGGYLKNRWVFSVPSLQSIWYGQKGNIFDPADTEHLLDYTAQAFQFAHSLNCPSLVFGCPKNRMRPLGANDAAAEAFFMQAGNLAARYGVHLAPMLRHNRSAPAPEVPNRIIHRAPRLRRSRRTIRPPARHRKVSACRAPPKHRPNRNVPASAVRPSYRDYRHPNNRL